MSDENKIIPINRAFIRSLERVLKDFKECCTGDETYNAIFIDNKGFIKQGTVKGVQPVVEFAVRLPIEYTFTVGEAQIPSHPICSKVPFYFYRQIGETLEYRENV